MIAALLAFGATLATLAPARSEEGSSFRSDVRPFLETHCVACHDEKVKAGNLVLDGMREDASARAAPAVWKKVRDLVSLGAMPPSEKKRPDPADVARLIRWIDGVTPPEPVIAGDPGRVTLRRLNRAEYRNTIRDLLALDDHSSDGFPSDDVGYGFDDVGDVLTMPPLLFEKYAQAAERIAQASILVEDPTHPASSRFEAGALPTTLDGKPVRGARALFANGDVHGEVRLPRDGEYVMRAKAFATQAGEEPAQMLLTFDAKGVGVFDVLASEKEPQVYEKRFRGKEGTRAFSVAFTNDYYEPKNPDRTKRDRNLIVQWVEVAGPVDALPEMPASHRRIFASDPGGADVVARARKVVGPLATRAWRRPVEPQELERLVHLVTSETKAGEPFEQGIRTALQAILVSPHFLFHVEVLPRPDDPRAIQPLGDHALAARLSYFLWSSLPDAPLVALATKGTLRDHLEREVKRMLADPRAGALVDGFAAQWLTLRRLPAARPDPERFPAADEALREDMLRETEMFFEAVVAEDRSVLDFVDAPFTFVNERLAAHYGISGVTGERFRRVPVDGIERGGIFTQASVLTVTSYPTRTSPVRRGKWLLEQVLGQAVPPPPPGAGDLNESHEAVHAKTLRQRMEAHRKDPACASCHAQLDPLGFGLESYDAVGAWRTREGTLPLDVSGSLPDGRKFSGSAQLRALLRNDPRFVRGFTEKLLTYALGRGLLPSDGPVVDAMVTKAKAGGLRFSKFVVAIVESDPFTKARGEEPNK